MAVLLGFCWVSRTSADVLGCLLGARGRNRTGTALTGLRILSPLRLPISPPGHGGGRGRRALGLWRPGSELNRRTRLCRPLHNHSATWPCLCTRYRSVRDRGAGRTLETTKPRVAEVLENWSGKRDSNSRPRPWQGRALPTELFPQRNANCKCGAVAVNPRRGNWTRSGSARPRANSRNRKPASAPQPAAAMPRRPCRNAACRHHARPAVRRWR